MGGEREGEEIVTGEKGEELGISGEGKKGEE